MRKLPARRNNDITQSYNDGIVQICHVEDAAAPGYAPEYRLTPKINLRFSEQRLGINRLYLSRQNQVEILRVLRIPRRDDISSQDVAIVNGKQYQIDSCQIVPDVWPSSQDVSLKKVEQEYDVV